MRQVRVDMREYYKLPHPQLKLYLKRQVTGNDEIYTTPFANNVGFDNAYAEWLDYLDSHLNDWPGMLEYEHDLGKKVGYMSVQKPLVERLPSLESYYSDILVDQSDVDPEIIRKAWNQIGRPRELLMLTREQSLAQMKLSTNSGNPYFTKRRLVVEKNIVGMMSYDGKTWYVVTPDGVFKATATLGWRGQEGGMDVDLVKQRDLWMFTMVLNLEEARVYKPVVSWGQKSDKVVSWKGNDAVDRNITRLFDTKGDHDLVICTDFTKFDQHFGPAMQQAALSLLQLMFKPTREFEQWVSEVYPAKYNIPIVISWGKALMGYHGMASGSGGTNADETLGHTILQHEAAILSGQLLNPYSMCLGDDGILSYPGISVEHVLDTYTSHGQEMNETKQMVSYDECVYLRRYHHKNYRINNVCVGVYSTLRALGKLKFLERFHDPRTWGVRPIVTRSLSIIENCCYHPLREEFLDHCIKWDKYRLGLDIPGYLEGFDSEVEKAVNDGVLGYQYTDSFAPKPAKSWWVYKALLARR